jgi:hypothetical protein
MDGWMGGWMGGWVGVKAVLRIAYSNQKVKTGEGDTKQTPKKWNSWF